MRFKEYLHQLAICLGLGLLVIGCGLDCLELQNVFGLIGFALFAIGAGFYFKK